MADLLITGEAQLNPISHAVGLISTAFENARKSVATLSKDVASESGSMKQSLFIATEAMNQLNNEIEFARKSGAIKGLSREAKGELASLEYAFKGAKSEVRLFVDEAVRGAKEITDADRRRTQIARQLNQDRKLAALDEEQRAKALTRILNFAHGQAIAEDRRRTTEAVNNAKRRAAEEAREAKEYERAQAQKRQANAALLGSLKALALGYGLAQIKAFTTASVDAAIALERVRFSLVAATGSLEEGAKAYEYTRNLAYKLGLDLAALSKQYGLFSAAVKDTGFTQNQMRSIFESVAEASRVLGLSVADMQGVFVALQQIATKGTVQMEELRQQLGDRLPGSVAIMAKALGVSQRELFHLTKNGLVPAKEALILFDEELRKRLVDGSLTGALEGIQVKINNLRNAIFELKASFGEGFADGAVQGLGNLSQKALEMKESFESIGGFFGRLVSGIVSGANYMVVGIRLASVAVKTLNQNIMDGFLSVVEGSTRMLKGMADNAAEFYRAIGLDSFAEKAEKFSKAMDENVAAAERARAQVKQNKADLAEFGEEVLLAARGQGLLNDSTLANAEASQRTTQSLKDLADARLVIDGITGKNKKSEDDLIEAVRREILEQRGLGKALSENKAIREASLKVDKEHETAITKLAKEIIKEQEAIEGSIDGLARKGLILQEAITLAEQDGVVTAKASETIKQKVGEQYDAYERLGVAVPDWLQAIADKYGHISKEQKAFFDALEDAADKAEERATKSRDKARDSSGERFGEEDLIAVEDEIRALTKKKDDAVSELLGATDAAEVKKYEKQVEEAEKQLEDRFKRREQIFEKIQKQNEKNNAAEGGEKASELKKNADELRSQIAALEAKQANEGLSAQELDTLFKAKDALADTNFELQGMRQNQSEVAIGWTEIRAETDAAQDAWNSYYDIVISNSLRAKAELAQQGEQIEGVATKVTTLADGTQKISNVTGNWTSAIREVDGVYTNLAESTVTIETLADGTKKLTNDSAALAETTAETGDAIEETGEKGKEATKALADGMSEAATETDRVGTAMKNMAETYLPKMIELQTTYNKLAAEARLGSE